MTNRPLLLLLFALAWLAGTPAFAYYIYGYINRTGKLVINNFRGQERVETQLDEKLDFHDGRALRFEKPIHFLFDRGDNVRRRYFFIDKTASGYIGPYEWAQPFSNGIASVIPQTKEQADQFLTFIDRTGKAVGQTNLRSSWGGNEKNSFISVGPMNNGRILVHHLPDYDKTRPPTFFFGFMDSEGKWQIKPQFHRAADFSNGLAVVQIVKRIDTDQGPADVSSYGYIDPAGHFVCQPTFCRALPFSENLAFVAHQQRQPQESYTVSVINTQGQTVFSLPENNLINLSANTSFHDGLALLVHQRSYINTVGQTVISQPPFSDLHDFHEGLAVVRDDSGKYGYMNKFGSLVIPASFEMAGDFSSGLAAVRINNLWGFIDKTGQFVIKPQFLAARPFSEGLAAVMTSRFTREEVQRNVHDSMLTFIDRSGATRYSGIIVRLANGQRVIIAPSTCPQGLRVQEQPTVHGPGKIYGPVKSIPTAAHEVTLFEVPSELNTKGIEISDDIPAPQPYIRNENTLRLKCGIGGYDCHIRDTDNDGRLIVEIRPVLPRAVEKYGGEALINADGELVGMALEYNYDPRLAVYCLPSTVILRTLAAIHN